MNDQYEYDYMEEADILEIFFSPPINQFLKVSSYTRPRARSSEPITYVEGLPALALA